MHKYRAISVMAHDNGKDEPYAHVTLACGPDSGQICLADKRIPLKNISELRDLLDWAAEAYGEAFDELFTDGWNVTHSAECPDGKVFSHAQA